MTTFQSAITIHKPVQNVYNFLADMNNHRLLMPENILDWVSTYDAASFNIQNMAKLSLVIENRVENTEIKIVPSEKPPFAMELKWSLTSNGNATNVVFTITADLNMMMKMLVSSHLKKLADHETQALESIII